MGECKCLDFAVMGSCHGDGIAGMKLLQYAHCKGRAFYRVGACSQLVQQHQRPVVSALQYAYYVRHMGGEGGEGLLYRLLVAYVCIYAVEYGYLASNVRRYEHAALGHEHKQSHSLQRYRLAARVWACDYKRPEIAAQPYVYWPHRFLRYERVTSLHYTYIAGVIEFGLRGVHVPGQLCLGKRQVHIAQDSYILVYLTAVGRHHCRKL